MTITILESDKVIAVVRISPQGGVNTETIQDNIEVIVSQD